VSQTTLWNVKLTIQYSIIQKFVTRTMSVTWQNGRQKLVNKIYYMQIYDIKCTQLPVLLTVSCALHLRLGS